VDGAARGAAGRPALDPVVATAALDWAGWALRRARLVFLAGGVLLVVVVVLEVFSHWVLLTGGGLVSAMAATARERRRALEVLEALVALGETA